MTEYGEILTLKGNSESNLIIPGIDDAGLPYITDKKHSFNFAEWEVVDKNTQILRFKDFCLKHYILGGSPSSSYKLSTSKDFAFMQFCIQGECTICHKKCVLGSFKSSEHNIIWFPAGEIQFDCSFETVEIIHFYFEKEFLLKYFPDGHNLPAKINTSDASMLFKHNLYLGHKIQNILQDMLNCAFTSHLKKLYIQAKAIELLSLQLVQQDEDRMAKHQLKQVDIDKMLTVKRFIDKNDTYGQLSLALLAREAGTNEQYLKRNFKIVFGTTVFGYILSSRMEKARIMLLSGKHKISHIAELSGYKHATHFTTAFKKFYGYVPQKIKGEIMNKTDAFIAG